MITIDKGIVSRWKIDTRFENWLSHKADHCRLFKILYCKYYALLDNDYYTKGIRMAKKTMEDFHANRLKQFNEKEILNDMIYCLHRFGFSYEEYFLYELYDKNAEGKDEYISDKMRYEYYYYLNTEDGLKLLKDKGQTYSLLKNFYKRDCVAVYDEDDLSCFINFTREHPQFLYKPIELDCGRGVKKIDVSTSQTEKIFTALLKNGPFIVEEIIIQSEELAKFHPKSVNSVRLITVRCKDGVHAPYACMRMGRGDATVDNAGAGGIFASIDADSGVVISKAVVEHGNDKFIFHPDTKEKIMGFQLPEWDQAKELVKTMAVMIPNVRYIGWDIAFTDKGWVLIEANGKGQFLNQMADKIGIKQEFLKLMDKA